MKQNESREDYLERILMLEKENGIVRAIDIAKALNFSKPSISIALKKLKNDELIEIDENNHITLTEEGRVVATKTLEKHTVISSLLQELGVSPETALEDACKIEHDLSDETFKKIKEYYEKRH